MKAEKEKNMPENLLVKMSIEELDAEFQRVEARPPFEHQNEILNMICEEKEGRVGK